MMPADEDEMRVRRVVRPSSDEEDLSYDIGGGARDMPQRFELFHRMIRFVFGNKIYVGPVEKVLSPDRGERLRVLDMGTGGGLW
jgi:hypothetical protein